MLREKWEAMDADPSGLQMTLPTMDEVDIDRAGSLTVKDEAEVSFMLSVAAVQRHQRRVGGGGLAVVLTCSR